MNALIKLSLDYFSISLIRLLKLTRLIYKRKSYVSNLFYYNQNKNKIIEIELISKLIKQIKDG